VDLRPDGLPDIVWCEVPAGPFLMGSDEAKDPQAYDEELPQHEVTLLAYSVSKYPVTNAQYRLFVEGGGYEEPHYWTPDGWAWRSGQREPDLSPIEDKAFRKNNKTRCEKSDSLAKILPDAGRDRPRDRTDRHRCYTNWHFIL